jgi:16S rRNA (adenine1518-N6/adenine1519-N6)-dimethyltransferase
VAAGAFFPPPRVESAILRIVPMTQAERKAVWGVDPEQIMAVAKKGFAHPRKKLSSNLGIKDFGDLGLDSNIRAEDLTTEDWVKVAASLS